MTFRMCKISARSWSKLGTEKHHWRWLKSKKIRDWSSLRLKRTSRHTSMMALISSQGGRIINKVMFKTLVGNVRASTFRINLWKIHPMFSMALVKLTLITFSLRLSPNSNQWEIFWAINKFLSPTSVTSTFLKRLSWTKTSDCFKNSNFQWQLKQTIRSRQNLNSPLKYLEGL